MCDTGTGTILFLWGQENSYVVTHILVGEIDAQQSHQDNIDTVFPHHPLQCTTPGHLLLH